MKDVCKVMYDSTTEPHLREFQFKILHNYLPLNDKLYKWKISACFRCSYCFISAESDVHLFCHCLFTKIYNLEIKQWLAMCNVNLPNCDDNIILYGISPSTKHNTLLNHIIMLFKHFVYNCRSNIKSLNLHNFLLKVQENEKIEFKIAKKGNKLFLHELKKGKFSLHLKSI